MLGQRPRHASRVVKPGDENQVTRTALGGKAVNSVALHGKAGSQDKIQLATATGRRALNDLSNATRIPDRTSKDGIVKPSRSRQTSQSSATSTASSLNGTTKPTSTTHRRALSAKNSTTSLRDGPVASAVPRIRSISENAAVVVAPGAPKIGPLTDEQAGYDTADEIAVVGQRDAQGLGIAMVSESDGMQVDHSAGHDVEEQDGYAEELDDPENWMMLSPHVARAAEAEVAAAKQEFQEELDFYDMTMVPEYTDEIFAYMARLEDTVMAHPHYMDHQTEIEWSMRATLIDWLLQVHVRYHMLPETLWIAVNIIDRFLSNRVVSLVKLQLVGVTAMFIAAKYEEIMAPSVEEFVYMTENGYTREEILKGERIILSSLEFNISSYCTPYSWVRRISKADDYDIQTRTLSKFLMEVTLLDHRFLRAKPSMIAAIGMYVARKMLGGEWDEAFVYYSGYAAVELLKPTEFLCEALVAPDFEERFVYKKYSNKKFLKAAIFARNWAKSQFEAAS